MIRRIATGLTLVLLSSAAALAQTAPAPASGPLTLEPIHSPLTVAAEYKITDLDGQTSHMAGVRAGWLADDVLFVGGAVYWLPEGRNRSDLTYGGAMVGWLSSPRHRIRFGGTGLVGVGTAQLATDVQLFGRDDFRRGGRIGSVRLRDDFFVFEPAGNVTAQLANHFSIDLSAGYRAVGSARALRDRLDGATGSLALRFTF